MPKVVPQVARKAGGGGGGASGGPEVRQDATVLYDNPMSLPSPAEVPVPRWAVGRRLRKQVTAEAAEHSEYHAAHAKH